MTPGEQRQVMDGWRAVVELSRALSSPAMTPEQSAWVQAWCAVAGAGIQSATSKRVPAKWADQMLEDFRERWG